MTVWSNVILCLFACCIWKMDVQQSTSYIKWYIAFAENNQCLFNNSAYTIEKPRRPLVWCVMWPGQGHSGHTRHQQMLHPVSGKKRAFTHFRQVITIHTYPQERSSHGKLHKTSDIIFHGYLPSRTWPVVSHKCRMGKFCTIANFSSEIR